LAKLKRELIDGGTKKGGGGKNFIIIRKSKI